MVLGIPIVVLATLFFVGQNLLNSGILPEVASLLLLWISLSLIFLSLITYLAKDEVFRAWWNFAKWWVAVLIVVTILLEKEGGGGGFGGGLSMFFIGSFYLILIGVSLVKIVRVYLRTKNVK